MAGGLLGIILGILVIVVVFVFLGRGEISLTVGVSLLSITMIAATTGAALPFLFHSLGFDPALMSAPLITTPAFLTKSAIANSGSLTSSGFDPGNRFDSKTTVCC